MSKSKERALLHASDRKLRYILVRVAAGLFCLAILLILAGFIEWSPRRAFVRAPFEWPPKGIQLEIYKLVLQLILVTAGGGAVLALLAEARDATIRRQTRAASIQALDRELDRAYRALKKVKRKLRAHGIHFEGGRAPGIEAAHPAAPVKIPRQIFEKEMEDLLESQLELETICDHIGRRDDILDRRRLARMRAPLRYASRYYHDVHEDFEKGKARLVADGGDVADHYDLSGAPGLRDFLSNSRNTAGSRTSAFEDGLRRLKKRGDLAQRRKGLTDLLVASPDEPGVPDAKGRPGKVRYAYAAAACFDLLSAELAEARFILLTGRRPPWAASPPAAAATARPLAWADRALDALRRLAGHREDEPSPPATGDATRGLERPQTHPSLERRQ